MTLWDKTLKAEKFMLECAEKMSGAFGDLYTSFDHAAETLEVAKEGSAISLNRKDAEWLREELIRLLGGV